MNASTICACAFVLLLVGLVRPADAHVAQTFPFRLASAAACRNTIAVVLPAVLGGSGMGEVIERREGRSSCPFPLGDLALRARRLRAFRARVIGLPPPVPAQSEPPPQARISGGSDQSQPVPASPAWSPDRQSADRDAAASRRATGAASPSAGARSTSTTNPTGHTRLSAELDADAAHLSRFVRRHAPDLPSIKLAPARVRAIAFYGSVGVLAISLVVFLVAAFLALRAWYFAPRSVLARAVARGLRRRQFYLEYQPMFRTRTRECVGVEILLRWRDSVHGLRGAEWFMAELGNHPVVIRLLQFMLDTVRAELDSTRAANALHVMLTLPASCVEDPARAAAVATRIHAFSAERVVLELPCDALGTAGDGIRLLQDENIRISLCDLRSPGEAEQLASSGDFQYVKLHRDVMTLEEGARIHTLKAFSAWARSRNVPVVADGVEGVGQYHAAGHAQIALAQGFFLCKALSFSRLLGFMERFDLAASTRMPSLRQA